MFEAFEADLPVQMGQTIELRDYQQEATENLQKMREEGKTIVLLYYATGVGKTITAATDAKAVGGRTLFMARPTMSKTIYLQQLGRGTRRCPGKEDLLVVDFVDNANMFNMPYSLHCVLDIAKYQPMAYVLAPENKRKLDQDIRTFR